jgi:hypothetical protein
MYDIEITKDIVAKVQEHYLSQFRDFIQRQRELCKVGSSEVKFSLGGDTNAFDCIAVIDFVQNDNGVEGILFEPEKVLSFERIEGCVGNAELVMTGLRWDGAVIRHDVKDVERAIKNWFMSWFDPDETSRFDTSGDMSCCIHAVYIEPQELQVDFGTASPEAFWELLDCLASAGASQIEVSA